MRIKMLVGVLMLMFLCGTASAELVQWTTGNGGNGHWYEVILTDDISWTNADAAANGFFDGSGYLATSTSAGENAFIVGIIDDAATVNGTSFTPREALWLGGYNTVGDRNAWGNWVTGETWDYTNWKPGEPNDLGYLAMQMVFDGASGGEEGDWRTRPDDGDDVSVGYIVEYDVNPVPIPGAVFLLGSGLVGIVGIRKKPKK